MLAEARRADLKKLIDVRCYSKTFTRILHYDVRDLTGVKASVSGPRSAANMHAKSD